MNFTPEEFATYPGTVSIVEHDRVPVLRFQPGSDGYGRFVTKEHFIPPVSIAGWFQVRKGPESPGNRSFDGIHIHVGHIGNSRNYVASILRRDRGAKINIEYGWRGYQNIYSASEPDKWAAIRIGTGPELVWTRTYFWKVNWLENEIQTFLANEMGSWRMDARIEDHQRIPSGALGFRLDSIDALGDFTIREL